MFWDSVKNDLIQSVTVGHKPIGTNGDHRLNSLRNDTCHHNIPIGHTKNCHAHVGRRESGIACRNKNVPWSAWRQHGLHNKNQGYLLKAAETDLNIQYQFRKETLPYHEKNCFDFWIHPVDESTYMKQDKSSDSLQSNPKQFRTAIPAAPDALAAHDEIAGNGFVEKIAHSHKVEVRSHENEGAALCTTPQQ